jgi:hypothetical protein
MTVRYAKNKQGRTIVISGPRGSEYLEKSSEELRELSAHLHQAMGVPANGNGNGIKK